MATPAAHIEEQRAHALDVGRGIAILAVIYGHALAPWFMGTNGWFSFDAFVQWKFGASFLMPFFFFISGIGWRAGASMMMTIRRAITLIAIAWGASFALDVVHVLLSATGLIGYLALPALDAFNAFKDAVRMIVYGDHYSMSALWFLAALGITRVLAAISGRVGPLFTVLMALALLTLSLCATQLSWRNFHQVFTLGIGFIAFMGGYWSRHIFARLETSKLAVWLVLLGCGAVVTFTFGMNEGCTWDWSARCGHTFLEGHFGVSMYQGAYGNIPLFLFTMVFGVWFAAALAILIARYGAGASHKIATWGRESLDLLIVNALFYEAANPAVSVYLAPHIAADTPLFFVTLLAIAIVVNLIVAALLKHPLRLLRRFANWVAQTALEVVRHVSRAFVLVPRSDRVSQGHD